MTRYIIVTFLISKALQFNTILLPNRKSKYKINILHSQSRLHRLIMYFKNAMMNYLDTFRHFSEDRSSF